MADNTEALKAAAQRTTSHGKLVSLSPFIDGDTVFLVCRYETGDASGQNMVNVATQAMCEHICDTCPIRPVHWFIEPNFSGDKKATYLGLQAGRGRKVTASVEIPDKYIKRYLHLPLSRCPIFLLVQSAAARAYRHNRQGFQLQGLKAQVKRQIIRF